MLPEVFSNRRPQQERARDEMEAELYRQIGQLKVELEWLIISLSLSQGLSLSDVGSYGGSAGPGGGVYKRGVHEVP
jgi:hypothetical protein